MSPRQLVRSVAVYESSDQAGYAEAYAVWAGAAVCLSCVGVVGVVLVVGVGVGVGIRPHLCEASTRKSRAAPTLAACNRTDIALNVGVGRAGGAAHRSQ